MKYEVVVVVSKLEIQLFYSQNRNAYQVFEYEGTPKVPFCVFSDGSAFEIGKPAKLKYDKGLGNCFYDYFNLIKDQKLTFPYIIESKKPIKFILFQFIESLLNKLLAHLLTGNSINDVRKEIRLNLVFANDIEDRHIDFVGNLFKENGFGNLSCVSYRYLFLNYLKEYKQSEAFSTTKRKVNDLKGFVNVDAIDDDLHLSFFDNIQDKSASFVNVGEGLAKDPKVEILAKQLFETTANATGSLAIYEKEKAMLIPLAKKYVKENKREFRVEVTLSDGSTKRALIKMSRIDDMLFHYSSMSKDIDLVEACVRKTKTKAIDLGIVVHNTVNSQNFIDFIKRKYINIFVSDIDCIDVLDIFLNNEQVIERGDRINANKPTKSDSGDIKTSQSNTAGTSGPYVTTSTTVKTVGAGTTTNPVSNENENTGFSPPETKKKKTTNKVPPPPPPPPPPPMGVNKPELTSPNKQVAPKKTTKKVPPPPPFIGSPKGKTSVPPTNPVANKKSKTAGVPPPNPIANKKGKRPPPPPPPPPIGKK